MNKQANLNPSVGTWFSHEREPHCCGCWILDTDKGEAICNECGETVNIIDLLRAHTYKPKEVGEVGGEIVKVEGFDELTSELSSAVACKALGEAFPDLAEAWEKFNYTKVPSKGRLA